MVGSYVDKEIGKDNYKTGNSRDQLARTKDGSHIKPFRTYIHPSWDPSKFSGAPLFMNVQDDSETTNISKEFVENHTISEVYSVNGIKQNELKKGINIVRMKDGSTKKIIK